MLAAFEPRIGRLALAARRTVLTVAPSATEMVYDAYNTVSAVYSYTGRLKEAFLHIAAYAAHDNLGFNHGASLTDPSRLLAGTGASIRHVRLTHPRDLLQPAVRALIDQAVAQAGPVPPAGQARTIVKPTCGRKRRPRRSP